MRQALYWNIEYFLDHPAAFQYPAYTVDRDERNNRTDNLKGATFDEYYDYMEEVITPRATRWRTLRLNKPAFMYNPFYTRRNQKEMLTQYMISNTGSLTSTLIKELMTGWQLQTPCLAKWYISGMSGIVGRSVGPLSCILLDTFKGIDAAKPHPIFLDGNTANLSLNNLKHGTKEEYRDHMLKLIIEKYPEEPFTNVEKQQWGTHRDYIISNKGRLYSLITGHLLKHTFTSGSHAGIFLNGTRYIRNRVAWTAFNEKIPFGKRIVHKNARNWKDDPLANLECVEKGICLKKEILLQEIASDNLSLNNLPNEQWERAPSHTIYSRDLPVNVFVSTYDRVKYNNTIIEKRRFSSYLTVYINSVHFLCA